MDVYLIGEIPTIQSRERKGKLKSDDFVVEVY